jgi:predicted RNase H-like nuclease
VPPRRGSITLDPDAIHLLSNHLAVIVGFVELMLADAAPGDAHFNDLVEIRAAALAAASLISRGQATSLPPSG